MTEFEYWGALNTDAGAAAVPDVTKDIEFAMNSFNNIILHESDDEEHSTELEKIIVPPLNPLILYAISLHKHANNSLDFFKLNKHVKDEETDEVPLPLFNTVDFRHTNLNLHPHDFSDFDDGTDTNLFELSGTVVRKILVKSIATLFAHIGYETCDESALDILVDVLQEFLKKITNRVKVATNEEMFHTSGFPHIIEQVLTELGLGGVRALSDYYQARVVKYVNVLEKRCKKLNRSCESLSYPQSVSPVDKISQVVRVKVEEEDVVEVENPEVHFTSIEGDVSFSILETGYQLLNSLEAEANLQGIGDAVDSVDSVPTDDHSHLSPFSKRKRFNK